MLGAPTLDACEGSSAGVGESWMGESPRLLLPLVTGGVLLDGTFQLALAGTNCASLKTVS